MTPTPPQHSPSNPTWRNHLAEWRRKRYVAPVIDGAIRYQVAIYVLLGLIALFGLLGYFWLPGFAKGKAETLLSEKLHRPVTIQAVEIHPYTLEATIRGFRLGEKDAAPDRALLTFDSLYVNLSSMTFVRRVPVITAVTLKNPAGHLEREKDGQLSIADLIEEFTKPEPDKAPTRYSVSNIQIEGGRIDFDDRLKRSRQTLSDIRIGLPFVSNLESAEEAWVQPLLSARINDGSVIALSGRARPFADTREATLDLKLDDFDLTKVIEYAPPMSGIRLGSAKLDSKLELSFTQPKDKAPAIDLHGDVSLRQLAVDNKSGVPWSLRGERIDLRLQRFDPTMNQPIEATLGAANLRLKQGDKPELHVDKLSIADVHADTVKHAATFAVDAQVNGHGRLRTKGNIGWAPLAFDLDVDADQIDLVGLQGWAGDRLNALLTRGAASFEGKIKGAGTPLNVAVSGDGQLSDFSVMDKANATDLLRWRSLDVSGLKLNTAPFNADIQSVALADFFARVLISPEGKLNLRDIVKHDSPAPNAPPEIVAADKAQDQAASKVVGKSTAGGSVTTAPVPEKSQPTPIRIGQVLLQGGNVNFSDRFIKPNYRANLTNLGGKIGPLDPGKPGQVDIRGAVDRSAPLEIGGKVDPFGKELFLDLRARAKSIDLPAFSPYSGKYLGYKIQKGKLTADVRYAIQNGQLTAENNIFLDQLTLGEKVESPDALSIPLSLAIALLKNSRGEIDLNIPVSGSLNDPQFSLGSVIVTVIKNLLVKVVTSPFTLLNSIFGGGGADLSQVNFAPGRARIEPAEEKSLDALIKALNDRPALKLDIVGVADPASDAEALKHATLERRVKAQKQAEMAKRGESSGNLNDIEITPAEYPKYLEMAYKAEKFDKPKNLIGLSKSLPVPQMEQLMIANIPAGDEEMRSLGERRARVVRDWLIGKGVSPDRVFVLAPRIEVQSDGKKVLSRAEFSLH